MFQLAKCSYLCAELIIIRLPTSHISNTRVEGKIHLIIPGTHAAHSLTCVPVKTNVESNPHAKFPLCGRRRDENPTAAPIVASISAAGSGTDANVY